jgi:hypothetical protein
MKLDALICAVVIVLTAVVPSLAFLKGAESWPKHRDESASSAVRYEQLARDTESGKIKPDSSNFPAYLRLQARGQMELARMYGYLAESDRKFLSATFGVVGVQAALLTWLLLRRRKHARAGAP